MWFNNNPTGGVKEERSMSKVFRIVRIIGEKEFITNIGSSEGKKGDRYQIYNHDDDEPIVDPITEEELGKYSKHKAIIELTEIYDGFSIAKVESKTIDIDPVLTLGSAAKSLSHLMKQSTIYTQTAKIETHDIQSLEKTSNSPIKVGDLLRKVD